MSNIIDVKDLVLVYSDGTKAVDNISFEVQGGRILRFSWTQRRRQKHHNQNSNDSSKKNFGNVTIAGYDVERQAPAIRRIIGVQSQETTVDGDLTGRENITLQGHFHQMNFRCYQKKS